MRVIKTKLLALAMVKCSVIEIIVHRQEIALDIKAICRNPKFALGRIFSQVGSFLPVFINHVAFALETLGPPSGTMSVVRPGLTTNRLLL
ncbi:hypothetical protein PoB_001154200 [Plakobranchus ocellatus]|uniref:Uncharacterized protein n=1 Tax=Plakobranchus ocellatus TaxID=259542 RepID=A0AAV3YPY2_9GAST|nr:hypothetical protein PoB_001154200 [Plakobranchus ocellatus]